jgi:hypothetical protein
MAERTATALEAIRAIANQVPDNLLGRHDRHTRPGPAGPGHQRCSRPSRTQNGRRAAGELRRPATCLDLGELSEAEAAAEWWIRPTRIIPFERTPAAPGLSAPGPKSSASGAMSARR